VEKKRFRSEKNFVEKHRASNRGNLRRLWRKRGFEMKKNVKRNIELLKDGT
jgi:hypothetical protein